MPSDWFDKFDLVLVDEAHGAKAKALTGIMEKLTSCEYRFGTTGTIDDIQVHKFVLEGLFGKVNKIVDTKTLIDNNYLSELNIKCLLLQYSAESRKNLKRDYQEEIDFLISHQKRNNFIANLSLSLKDHVLVLYRRVEDHGKILYDTIKERAPEGTKVFFVSGGTDADERNDIRKIVDNEKEKCIVVASLGTFSTGINIINIHNIIFASPTKSKITNLQSIGRGLRRGADKTKFTLFDIADDLSKSSGNKNYTLLHFAERLRIYNEERFPYKIHTIRLEQ
jgi:superfamily II DNA or RNA helicase